MKINISLAIFTLFFVFTSKIAAQVNRIDTLSFSTESGFLVIKGTINGKEALLAFDTGAIRGILTSKQATANNINKTSSILIYDTNKEETKTDKGKINSLTIGSHIFENIESFIFDMPYLDCYSLYLLGGDVINQLNWKFDFTNKVVYVSKTGSGKIGCDNMVLFHDYNNSYL